MLFKGMDCLVIDNRSALREIIPNQWNYMLDKETFTMTFCSVSIAV